MGSTRPTVREQTARRRGGVAAKMSQIIQPSAMILGEVASPGVARGVALACACGEQLSVPRRMIEESDVGHELERFENAIAEAEQELLDLQREVQQRVGGDAAKIFQAHISLLRDPALRHEVSTRCLTEHVNVEAAVEDAIEKLASIFAHIEAPYFRERAADVRDLGKRLLNILNQAAPAGTPAPSQESVIVTSELLPSVTARLDHQAVRGLIVEQGGQTAHATILARELGIPLLIHVPQATQRIQSGDRLIVDGLSGRVFINPAPSILREYDRLEADFEARRTALEGLVALPAVTRDGVEIKLGANVGKSADAAAAASLNADGVGLYRTEFVFLAQDHFPSEEEQYRLYRTTANHVQPREVVIRLLDIGGDKPLPYFPLPLEPNPSLGLRGTRLLLAHPEMVTPQLRAILRLSATHPVSILLPMVSGAEDVRAVKAVIESVKASLTSKGESFNPRIPIGAMIETPSAAILIGRLGQEVDFFSIGTNDLVQYLLTTDRTSSKVASYYEPLHPAVLQMLASLTTTVGARGKSISICGEMAGNPAYTQLLLGLGFRSLSVRPGELLEVKNAVRSTTMQAAQNLAQQVLQCDTIQEIKDCLQIAQQRLAATIAVERDVEGDSRTKASP